MISRNTFRLIVLAIGGVLVAIGVWTLPFIRGLWPAIGPAAPIPTFDESVPRVDGSVPQGPLSVPDGWTSEMFVDDIPDARDLVMDSIGNLWVSQPDEGTVSLIDLRSETVSAEPVLRGLDRPHGLVFDPDDPFVLYIAEEHRIVRIRTYSEGIMEEIAPLPQGGRHRTRSLAFGPDGRLYVSIGSTCDVCHESDMERGSVISMMRDGSDRRMVARGLRNAVFMAFHPNDRNMLWVTEMGRDRLGDDLPPDEINVIDIRGLPPESSQSSPDYGWPLCYGKGIHDTDFDANVYVRDPCQDTVQPVIEIPAHSAPLGLSFIPRTVSWPSDMRGDVVVAYHGSWNRSIPAGYKVVTFDMSRNTVVAGSERDLITGFLVGNSSLGRPVDALPTDDGILYVSDDKAGVIWKLEIGN